MTPPGQPIEDPADPRVSVYLGLTDHQLRLSLERSDPSLGTMFITEGDRLIERALSAGMRMVSMLRDPDRPSELEHQLDDDTPVYLAGREVARRLTGMHIHRGALACFKRPPPVGFDAVAGPAARTLLVTERVNNPTNLGAMVRSAAGLGIDGLILDSFSCDPLYRRASRVAMGASFTFPWSRIESLPVGFRRLRESGFLLAGLALSNDAVDIDHLPRSNRIALVVGNEGHGLTADTLATMDVAVRIPMTGGVDSLNVAAAAAIACWSVTRSASG